MAYPQWLNQAVFYEIYPQSFYDSNGDGIGDLPGIIAKLDYVKSLNVNAIWLNPCFVSPFMDAGYDISNYYQIAPRYGTNDDMRELCRQAHAKGIKIILDLVAGHTSIEHPWFKASASAEKSPYDDYFIWASSGQDIGQYRFISGIAPRDGLFMINFFACQPALNYGFHQLDDNMPWQKKPDDPVCIKVRDELKKIMSFWLDLGCDGFRVDMAPSLIKNDPDKAGVQKLWQHYRQWLEKNYPEAVLISEWFNPSKAIDAGFHTDFLIHFRSEGYKDLFMAEHSYFSRDGLGDSSRFMQEITAHLEHIKSRGFLAIPTGNHDFQRIRTNRELEDLKITHTFVLLLPGTPFLYYGDEIGMQNIVGLGNKEGSYRRSSCRTPMQWAPGKQAGFSTAAPERFYLPLDPDPNRPNVADQEQSATSLLTYTRRLIALRQAHPALQCNGGFRTVFASKGNGITVYERFKDNERFIVAVNPFARTECAQFALPQADKFKLILQHGASPQLAAEPGATTLTMPPCSAGVWQN